MCKHAHILLNRFPKEISELIPLMKEKQDKQESDNADLSEEEIDINVQEGPVQEEPVQDDAQLIQERLDKLRLDKEHIEKRNETIDKLLESAQILRFMGPRGENPVSDKWADELHKSISKIEFPKKDQLKRNKARKHSPIRDKIGWNARKKKEGRKVKGKTCQTC